MPEIVRTTQLKASSEPAAVVIHCSDPRFQPHFQEFLTNSLALNSYALIAVPGGVHFLIAGDSAPRFTWVGWSWVQFVRDVACAERVILIGHDDCRWYFSLMQAKDPARVRERQLADLRAVRQEFTERFGVRVETYYASLENGHAEIKEI